MKFVSVIDSSLDGIHIFSKSRSELAGALEKALAMMRADAAIWVSWPKKTAKVQTDITEDVVRELALPLGLVDIKVCAVDEIGLAERSDSGEVAGHLWNISISDRPG